MRPWVSGLSFCHRVRTMAEFSATHFKDKVMSHQPLRLIAMRASMF